MEAYDYEKLRESSEKSYKCCTYSLIGIIICLIIAAVMCMGCSPKVIEKVIHQTDTCYIEKMQRDSIYMHDSIYIHEWQKGDTIYMERDRWHTAYRDRLIHDTAYISRRDTISTVQYIDKPADISGWQWAQIWAGRLAMIAIGLLIGGWIMYRVIRKHV